MHMLQINKPLFQRTLTILILCLLQHFVSSQVNAYITSSDNCLTENKEGRIKLELDPYEGPYIIIWPDHSKTVSTSKKKREQLSHDDLGQGRHYFSVQNSVGCFNLMFIDMFDEQCHPDQSLKIQETEHSSQEELKFAEDDEIENNLNTSTASESEIAIAVYPNPFAEELQINMPKLSSQSTLMITNSQGIVMANKVLDHASLIINTADFPAGIYHVTILSNNSGPKTKKLIKVN